MSTGHFEKGKWVETPSDAMVETITNMATAVESFGDNLQRKFTDKKPTGKFVKGAEDNQSGVDQMITAYKSLYSGLYSSFNSIWKDLPAPDTLFKKRRH